MKKKKLNLKIETVRSLSNITLGQARGGEEISGPMVTCAPCATFDYPLTCTDWTRLRDCL